MHKKCLYWFVGANSAGGFKVYGKLFNDETLLRKGTNEYFSVSTHAAQENIVKMHQVILSHPLSDGHEMLKLETKTLNS